MIKHLKALGFKRSGNDWYHDHIRNRKGRYALRYDSLLTAENRGWYFVGSWEYLNKVPIKDLYHLINFVKYTFGINLKFPEP